MAGNNSIFNAETVEFLSKKGLEDVWALAKAKFFIKDDGDTQKADTLIKLETIGDLDANNTGILRRTIGGATNQWALDTHRYFHEVSIDSTNGLMFGVVNPNGQEEQTTANKPKISIATMLDAMSIDSTLQNIKANNTAGNLVVLDNGGKLYLSLFPDSILGQVTFGGTITGYIDSGTLAVTMSGIAKRQMESRKGYEPGFLDGKTIRIRAAAGSTTGATYNFGKNDCEGMYFIVTSGMIESGEVTRSWDDKSWEVGDWCVSTHDTWEKVDNTDAVTGIKFLKNAIESDIELGNVVISCAKIGALDLFTTTKQTMKGTLHTEKSIEADGGMAAYGISDMTTGGGGGGTSGVSVLRDWANYDSTDDTQVLGTNLAKAMKDNVTSKGDATHPVYFNANGVATPVTSFFGNAGTATKLQTARTITVGGKENTFDGSADISFTLADIGAQSALPYANGKYGISISGNADTATSAIKDSDGNNIADKFTITSNVLQSLQSQIDSVASRDTFDELKVSVLSSDIISAQNIYGALHGNADTADKVAHKLTIQKNGTTIGSAFDGGDDMTINIDDVASANTLTTEITQRKAADVNKVMIGGIKTRQSATPAMTEAISQTDANSALRFVRSTSDNTHVDIPRGTTLDINATNLYGIQTNDDAEFTRRTTCDDKNVGGSTAKFLSIKGNTIVWNEFLLPNQQTSANRAARSRVDNIWTITSNGTTNGGWGLYMPSLSYISGNKWCITLRFKSEDTLIRSIQVGNSAHTLDVVCDGKWHDYSAIVEAASILTFYANSTVASSESSYQLTDIKGFDVTKMFQGNEPASVDAFRALFPRTDYPYNAGQLLSLTAQKFVTDGFNQWDEEWEVGAIDSATGQDSASTTSIRCKNYISVFGGRDYYVQFPANKGNLFYYGYDEDKNYIASFYNSKASSGLLTIPDNVAYIRMRMTSNYGTTYNHDICINLAWSGIRNGEYEPYWKSEKALDLTTITGKLNGQGESVVIFPDGVKSAGSVHDEFIEENGLITKAVKRLIAVDMGTLTWRIGNAGYHTFWVHFNELVDAKNQLNRVVLSSKYFFAGGLNSQLNMPDKSIDNNTMENAGRIDLIIKDTDFSDAAAFKTAMSGVMLYYELATPLTYVLDEPLDPNFRVDDMGTEGIAPLTDAQGNPVTAPLRADIEYGIDARREVEQLPAKYLQKENFNIYADAHSSMEIHEDAQTADVTAMTIKIGDKEVDLVALTQAEIQAICN